MRARLQIGDGWKLWPLALLRAAGLPFEDLECALESFEAAKAVAASSFVQEAMAWQNLRAQQNCFKHLAGSGFVRAKDRRALRTLVRYIQRYAAKNDTIGFFGPLGWADIHSAAGNGRFIPAERLVESRRVSFEPWALKAVLNACPRARAAAPLRLAGHLRLVPGGVIGPTMRQDLTEEEEALCVAATGRLSRTDLCAGSGDASQKIDQLVRRGILQDSVPVSVAADPGCVTSPSPVARRFESHRRQLEDTLGRPELVIECLGKLERDFVATSGLAPTRLHGQTYAGRTLVYADCRRGGALALGPEALEPLAPLLSCLGALARGYTFRIAQDLVAEMRQLFRVIGEERVPLPRFWHLSDALFSVSDPPAVRRAAAALGADWAAAFGADTSIGIQRLRECLLPSWEAASPGWPGARHHSPDLMWSTPSVEAVLSGQATPIVSEFHPGVSTFSTLSVIATCKDRTQLEQLWAEDFPESLISPIPHEVFARSTQDARLGRHHVHIDTGHGYVSAHPGARVIRAADLDVVEADGRLWAEHITGECRYDLMAVFERRIKLRAAVAFPLGPPGPGPRRTVDNVILRRASWDGTPPSVGRDRYSPQARAALRKWIAAIGAPERVFVALPSEMKPVFVDASSDLSLDMLSSMLTDGSIRVTEMLPDGQDLWLRDCEGKRYTSELRLCMTDPRTYDGDLLWSS